MLTASGGNPSDQERRVRLIEPMVLVLLERAFATLGQEFVFRFRVTDQLELTT